MLKPSLINQPNPFYSVNTCILCLKTMMFALLEDIIYHGRVLMNQAVVAIVLAQREIHSMLTVNPWTTLIHQSWVLE